MGGAGGEGRHDLSTATPVWAAVGLAGRWLLAAASRYLSVGRVVAALCCALTAGWLLLGHADPPRQHPVSGQRLLPAPVQPALDPTGPIAATAAPVLAQYVDGERVPEGWPIFSTIGLGSANRGSAVTAWYPAAPDLATVVATREGGTHVTLTLEARGRHGASWVPVSLAGDRNPWRIVRLPVPPDATQFRLLGSSGRDSPDWVMFSVPFRPVPDSAQASRDVRRTLLTVVAVLTLLLGPGLAWAAARGRRVHALTVAIPGALVLAGLGFVGWLLAWKLPPGSVSALLVSQRGVVLLLVLLTVATLACPRPPRTPPAVWAVLGVYVALVLVVAGRGLWSPGPPGELYGGTTTRTFEPGSRADARLPYSGALVVLNGADPGQDSSVAYGYGGWSFGDRGPLAASLVAPVLASSGAPTPAELEVGSWQPVDGFGYSVYRITLGAANLVVVLVLAGVVTAVRGVRAGRLAAALAGSTPFLLHEGYFTWPKLLAAAWVLLAGYLALRDRPARAALCLGLGFLTHPLALLWTPAVGALWLGTVVRRHRAGSSQLAAVRVAAGGLTMVGTVAGIVGGWRALTGPGRSALFLSYLTKVDLMPVSSFGEWLAGRSRELAATLVPGYLPLALGDDPEINVRGGQSPTAIHWLMQYWTGLPFGFGLAAVPLLGWAVLIAFRRYPWVSLSVVALPFVVFTVFWGAAVTGMLREGLHPWVASLVIVCAVVLWDRRGSVPARVLAGLATLRLVDLALVLVGPVLFTGQALISREYPATDRAALVILALAVLWLWATLLASVVLDVWPQSRWRVEAARRGASAGPPVDPAVTRAGPGRLVPAADALGQDGGQTGEQSRPAGPAGQSGPGGQQ